MYVTFDDDFKKHGKKISNPFLTFTSGGKTLTPGANPRIAAFTTTTLALYAGSGLEHFFKAEENSSICKTH
jgi:hypothetical protein